MLALQSDLPPHAPSILSLLTGIASARPSALVEGADSNRWLIPGSSENISLFQVAGLPHRYRLFPSLYRGNYLLG